MESELTCNRGRDVEAEVLSLRSSFDVFLVLPTLFSFLPPLGFLSRVFGCPFVATLHPGQSTEPLIQSRFVLRLSLNRFTFTPVWQRWVRIFGMVVVSCFLSLGA